MEIRGVKEQYGPSQITPSSVQKPQADPAAADPSGAQDVVEISPAARYREDYTKLPPIRADKVAAARKAIESGQMDTPEKLSVAVDRMLSDVLDQ